MARTTAAVVLALCSLCWCVTIRAHDISKTPITWNREISRLIYDKCASCHRPGGTSFSLMTYQEVQPRAVVIRDAILARRMPPWGAVKGFGDFRNDTGLTQEQIELVTDWVEEDTPKGNNPRTLPKTPAFAAASPPGRVTPAGVIVSGPFALERSLLLDGLIPEHVADGSSMQIVASLPDGTQKPLVWLYEYKAAYRHPFLFRRPLELPAGTTIRGVAPGTTVRLLPR